MTRETASRAFVTAFTRMLVMTVITGVSLLLPAGTLRWWNAWVLLTVGIVLVATLTGVVFRNSPELLEERLTAASKAKGWDKVLVPILAAVLPLASNLLAGFDKRFGWSAVPLLVSALALAGMLAGIALTYKAMRANPFFSSHVRIQTDRGHTVVSRGPYAYVRHPGYTGTLIYNLCAPLLLGSYVALSVGVLMCAVFVLRTWLEDGTLRRELPGYTDYASRVRYRLVPFVW